jgi:hypothetical protein
MRVSAERLVKSFTKGADHRAHAERGVLEGEVDRERALLTGRFRITPG